MPCGCTQDHLNPREFNTAPFNAPSLKSWDIRMCPQCWSHDTLLAIHLLVWDSQKFQPGSDSTQFLCVSCLPQRSARKHPIQLESLQGRNKTRSLTSTWRLRKLRRLLWPSRVSSDAFRRKKSEVKQWSKERKTNAEANL